MDNENQSQEVNNAFKKGIQAFKERLYYIAIDWLLKAAEAGHTEAQYYLGMCYYYKSNKDEAIKWLRMAAKAGHTQAQRELGHILPYNDYEAYQWLKACGDTQEADHLMELHQMML